MILFFYVEKNRVTGQNIETSKEGNEAIGEEEEIEVNSSYIGIMSATIKLNIFYVHILCLTKEKKPNFFFAEVVGAITTSFQAF